MSIIDRLVQLRTVAVAVTGFIRRHPQVSIVAAMSLFILGPLLTGSGGASFLFNLFGLGIAALVIWRIMRTRGARRANRARQAHSRRHHQRQQRATNQQTRGGTP